MSDWAQFMTVVGDDPEPLVQVYRQHGLRAFARARLENRLKRWKLRGVGAVSIALWYVALGDSDSAFAWLDRAYEERTPIFLWVFNLFPNFDPIRDDPRFATLAERVGIPLVEPDGPLAALRPG